MRLKDFGYVRSPSSLSHTHAPPSFLFPLLPQQVQAGLRDQRLKGLPEGLLRVEGGPGTGVDRLREGGDASQQRRGEGLGTSHHLAGEGGGGSNHTYETPFNCVVYIFAHNLTTILSSAVVDRALSDGRVAHSS